MLNAGAALARVLNEDGIVANIVQGNADPVVGTTVTLDAGGSKLASGSAGIASYAWTVVDDGGGVVNGFSSATNAAVASLATLKAGKFVVRATVTSADTPARQDSATATVFVRSAASTPPPSGGGGGGGGGSLSAAWLLLLSLALLALRRAPAVRRG
jgi:serine protease